jgi:hypothetical protein
MIELVFGIVLSLVSPGEAKADPIGLMYKGLMTTNKIIQKEKNKDLDDSLHEEIYQMTKDSIYKLGGLK